MSRISSDNILFTRLGFDKRYLLNQPMFTPALCKLYVRALVKRLAKAEPAFTTFELHVVAIHQMADDIAELLVCSCRLAPEKQADATSRYIDFGAKCFKKKLSVVEVHRPASVVADEPAPWDETPVVVAPKAKAKRTKKQALQPALISA